MVSAPPLPSSVLAPALPLTRLASSLPVRLIAVVPAIASVRSFSTDWPAASV